MLEQGSQRERRCSRQGVKKFQEVSIKKEKPRDANVEAGFADGDKVQQGVN